MDFYEFWEKLRRLDEFKPELINPVIMIWEDDEYSYPVWFSTPSGNKIFGVCRYKHFLDHSILGWMQDREVLGVIHTKAYIKIVRIPFGETTIARRHFKKIWNLAKNYDEPFNPKSYEEKTVSYDYYKKYYSDGVTSTLVKSKSAPDTELEAKGWKMKKNVKKSAPGNLSYILPIMKHLIGDEIIE